MVSPVLSFECVTRHARGAWPRFDGADMTHSATGTATLANGEVVSFDCSRHFNAQAKSGERTDYTVTLYSAARRELKAVKWDSLKGEIRREFRGYVEAMADDSTPRGIYPAKEAAKAVKVAGAGYPAPEDTVTAPAPVAVSETLVPVKVVEVIDMTPTWSEILPTLLVIHENAETSEGRKTALGELERMAALADKYVAAQKALRS